jgi:hypothetical protein
MLIEMGFNEPQALHLHAILNVNPASRGTLEKDIWPN